MIGQVVNYVPNFPNNKNIKNILEKFKQSGGTII